MARRIATFRQYDVTRAIKAVVAAGGHVARIEISAEKIVLLTSETDATTESIPVEPKRKVVL
jgi:hypothetical protein